MTMSDAMMIPGGTPGSSQPGVIALGTMGPPPQRHAPSAMVMPSGLPGSSNYPFAGPPTGTSWNGPSWPIAGTSIGRSTPMGSSPYGKSVDMVDVCTQLMEGGAPPWPLAFPAWLLQPAWAARSCQSNLKLKLCYQPPCNTMFDGFSTAI